MEWIKRHLPAAGGGLLLVLVWIKTIVGFGGDIDFLVSRSQDPGWVGVMWNQIVTSPWMPMVLTVIGLGLIYWDFKRTVRRLQNAPSTPARGPGAPAPSSVPARSWASSAPTTRAYTRLKGQIRHNLHTDGGAMLVGRKGAEFALRFSVATTNSAHVARGSLRYLARVRGKHKGDKLSVSEFPNSPSFVVKAGERFLAVNGANQLMQGLIVEVKDDRSAEFDEVIFNYVIVPEQGEVIAI
jgi:hypothetical protein